MPLFMSTSFKILFADKICLVSFWVSITLYVLALLIILIAYRNFPPFLPIYNKLAWGYSRLGNTYEIAIPVGIPLGFSLLNTFLAKYMYARTPLLARFLFLVSFLIALFAFIFILKLTLIIL